MQAVSVHPQLPEHTRNIPDLIFTTPAESWLWLPQISSEYDGDYDDLAN